MNPPFSVRGRFVVALAVFGLTALAYLTPPDFFASTDFLRFHSPLHIFSAAALRHGHLPLWNPHVNLGRPHLADLQAGIFYPANLLNLMFSPHVAFFLLAALHLTLMTVGMARLAEHLGAGTRIRWAAGLAFAFSAGTSSTLQTGTIEGIEALAYGPWILLWSARLQEKPAWREFMLLGVGLALQLLCGHPQYSWITLVGVAVFLVARRMESPIGRNLRLLARDLAFVLACGLLAMLIDAVQLLPFFDLMKEGNRGTASLAYSAAWSFAWSDWAALVRPAKATFLVNWTFNLYPGVIVSLAGCIGFVAWRDRNRRALLAMALVAALISLGMRTPVFALLHHALPGVAMFRLHGRTAILVVMALCLAAALALPEIGSRRRPVLLLAGLVALVNIAVELRIPEASRSLAELAARLALIVAVCALLVFPGTSRFGRWRWLALVSLQLVDLGWATWAMKRTYAFPYQFPLETALKAELEQRGLQGPGKPPPRISMPFPYVRENAGMIYGWSTFNGYVSLSLDRVWVYLHRVLGIEPSITLNTIPANDIYHAGPFPYASMNLIVGYHPLSRAPILNLRPDARVYLARDVALQPSWHAAIDRIRTGHDFHTQALVETSITIPSDSTTATTHWQDCSAQIQSFAPERVHVRSECPHGSLLVLAEAYHPGWQAEVDGQMGLVIPANVWMRGVVLTAGHHDVVFTYRERKLALGAGISCMTLVGLAGIALWHRLRRRSRPA